MLPPATLARSAGTRLAGARDGAGESEILQYGLTDSLLDQFLNRKDRFRRLDLRQPRARLRVPWCEQRAAVLIGNDGNRIAAELRRFDRNLLFVHADERPED